MTLTKQLETQVKQRVRFFVDKANNAFDIDMPYPSIEFKLRGTTAGTATAAHKVNFNAGLLVDNLDEYMNDTIPHEVAHTIESYLYQEGKQIAYGSRRSHGAAWQKVMRTLGIDPSRCHKMDTSKTAMPKSKHVYNCSCCEAEIIVSAVVHNKIRRGYAGYHHTGCNQSRLEFNRSLGKVTMVQARDKVLPSFIKPKKAPRKQMDTLVRPGTKIEKALFAYNCARKENSEITRQEMITVLADFLECDRKRAAGYYQTCKKKVEK